VDGRLNASRVSGVSERLVAQKPRAGQILKELSRLVRLELDRRHATIERVVLMDERKPSPAL
jgi:hypothetical protein